MSILDKIPVVKTIRQILREEREKDLLKEQEENRIWSSNFINELKSNYEWKLNQLKGSKKYTKTYINERIKWLNYHVWDIVGDGNEMPKNPKWKWEEYKKENHLYPIWCQRDIFEDIRNI